MTTGSEVLMNAAWPTLQGLYRLTVTDAWYPEGGGNIEVASKRSQMHSMSSVLSGIKQMGPSDVNNTGALVSSTSDLARKAIRQSRESWIAQGRRTILEGRGICTDLAAAAAVTLIDCLNNTSYEARIEIISSGTHAFAVVNREGDVKQPDQWGNECFVVDLWYCNQFTQHSVAPAFWMGDWHPVRDFIFSNKPHLRIDCLVREPIGALF